MAASRPGNPDRGWNDPPVFDYQAASTVQSSPRRHLLNKRVAFPATNQGQENKVANTSATLNPSEPPPLPVHILPPAANTATPTPVPLLIPTLQIGDPSQTEPTPSSGSSTSIDCENLADILERLQIPSSEGLQDFIKQTFDEAVSKCTKLQPRVLEDINRKLQLFMEMWTAGQLSESVKCRMCKMAEDISKGLYENAWKVHLNLMVDYTAEVNQWMVGIKRLIHELKESSSQCKENSNTVLSGNILIPTVADNESESSSGIPNPNIETEDPNNKGDSTTPDDEKKS